MRRKSSPAVFEAIVVLVALAVAAGAGLIGWFVGHEMASASASSATATQAASVPAGHVGRAGFRGDGSRAAGFGADHAGDRRRRDREEQCGGRGHPARLDPGANGVGRPGGGVSRP